MKKQCKWQIVVNPRNGKEYAKCFGHIFPCYKRNIQNVENNLIWVKEIQRYVVNVCFG